MSNIQDIEKLAQQTFSNFEADVPAEVWTNIQAALPVSPAVPSANTAGNAKTAGNVFSKINSAALWSTSIAVVAVVAGWLYFSSTEEPKQEALLQDEIITAPIEAEQNQSSDEQFNNSTIQQFNNSPSSQSEKENNTIAAADNKNTSHETSSANDETGPLTNTESNKNTEQVTVSQQPAEPANQNTAQVTSDTKKEDAGAPDENNNETENSKPETVNTETETADAASLGFIPNIITPNSDNENDVFIIEGNNLKSLKVTIKDRTGKIVHQWNGLHGFWDGRLENGSDAKPGIYFYNIFATSEKGKLLTANNSFSLIR